MSSDLTLGQLLSRSLANSDKISNAPSPNDVSVQALLKATLADLLLCASLISHLGVLSTNESIEEVNTPSLRALLVHSLIARLHLLHHTNGTVQRLEHLDAAKDHFRQFIQVVDSYDVVSRDEKSLFAGPSSAAADQARRRDSKIAQFKAEKELNKTLDLLRSRRKRIRTGNVDEQDGNDYDHDDDEDDEVLRPTYLNLIKLAYLRAHVELGSIEQEVELLKHAMAMSDLPSSRPDQQPQQQQQQDADDTTWRLDTPSSRHANGPLLDPKGRVLRPFTILPRSAGENALSTRLRLESEVFRESWNLPTMTIDEFLDAERERGNILQGGGPNSSAAVDEARADERALLEDDTNAGLVRGEQGLQKKREQDAWRDEHKRGEGNRMNRG